MKKLVALLGQQTTETPTIEPTTSAIEEEEEEEESCNVAIEFKVCRNTEWIFQPAITEVNLLFKISKPLAPESGALIP